MVGMLEVLKVDELVGESVDEMVRKEAAVRVL